MLNAVPDLLFAFDTDGQMLWWNTRATAITGYRDAEIADMHPLDFVAQAAKEQIAEAIARVTSQETIELQETHLVTKDGENLPYEFTAAPLTNDDGSVWGLAGVGRNIAARKRFERISDGFYALDTDWRFTYLNSQAEELVGRSEEELLGTVIWEAFPHAVEMQVYDKLHTAMETQEPLSFDQYYPPLDTWFDIRAYPSETGLSVYFQDITARKERERELEQQRTALAQLDQFNTLVHGLVHAVVEESTRTDIEQTVCDQLATSDFYQAAWIGEQTRSAAEIAPRVGAGIDPAAMSNTSTEAGVDSTHEIAKQAAENRAVCVGQTRSDDSLGTACSEQREAADIEAVVAVPLEYRNALYGVLLVYATDSTAFDERQQARFADLGETIGFAIAAAERKEALVAETAFALTLSIRDPDQFFLQAATRFDTTVTLEGVTGRTNDTYFEYFTVSGVSPAEIRDLANQNEMIDHVRIVSSHDTECLCEVGVTDASITTTVAEYGGAVTAMTAEDGFGTVRINLPRTVDVSRVIDALETTVATIELQAKETVNRPVQTHNRFETAVTDQLTDKQRDVLETAYHAGFFEQPRNSTGEDIAESLGISPSTFHQHLRVGLRKLVGSIAEPSTMSS
ncbi:bacterio-opsin activator domain-containing protein [Haloarcula nitratireducens]|nr:bacterio-opsin activator domain-containing protein [Halomicroarcula nitratireducens]